MRPRPRSRPVPLAPLPLLLLAALAAGCEEPRNVGNRSASAPKPAPPEVKLRPVIGQRTQDIRDADAELKKNARLGTTKITAKDPITLYGNAYVTTIGKTSILQIEHALNLYQATNDRYPKDFEEFMAEIIKANNIALPTLPFYQEYGYNAKEHKLVILEYEDRKIQFQKQEDAKYGR